MRNIAVVRERQHDLGLETSFGGASCLAVDSDAGLIFSSGDGLTVACHRCEDGQELWALPLPEAAQQAGCDLAPSSRLGFFAHAPELEAVCLGLTTGELLLLEGVASPAGPKLEEVGSVDGGVVAGQWSPDGEALALLTGAGQLLLMSKDWELLAELPACPEGLGSVVLNPSNTAISWRGDGRYLATVTPDPAALVVATETAAAAAANRSAGSGGPGGGPLSCCRVQIWEREGCALHAEGEAAPALWPLLAWQPNGRNLYAVRALLSAQRAQQAQQLDEAAQQARVGAWKREQRRREAEEAAAAAAAGEASNRVVIYERNGLQHGGFDMPGGGQVAGLAWSPDSQLLAVVVREADGTGAPACRLQLWHRSNWHWYCKAERRYCMCDGVVLQWDDAAPRLLHVLTAEGDYQQLEFAWEALVSSRGMAVVVDGRRLLLTPLRHSVVPPPLAAAVVRCGGAVACAAICDFGEQEVVAAVLSSGALELAVSCEEDLWEETQEEEWENRGLEGVGPSARSPAAAGGGPSARTPARAEEPHIRAVQLGLEGAELAGARQAAWAGQGRLLVVLGADQLLELIIDEAAGTASLAAATRCPGPLLRCTSHPRGGCVLQLEGGAVLQYHPGGEAVPCPGSSFPVGCPRMAAAPLGTLDSLGPSAPLAFGLSARGQLYWGPQLLATEVTSFVLRSEGAGGAFLLYTTRSDQLHALPLSTLCSPLGAPPGLLGGSGGGGLSWGTLPSAAGGSAPAPALPLQQQQQPAAQQNLKQAMQAAMRPAAAQAGPGRDVRVRAVEQGALLVAAPPGGEEVILQMPRGNLEAIRPRALVLPAVSVAIDGGDWALAWELACVNRLDLNVLVDYRWPHFLAAAPQFVEQIADDQGIADLLSSLSPGSTVGEGGAYARALPHSPPAAAAAAAPEEGGWPATAGVPPAELANGSAGANGATAAEGEAGAGGAGDVGGKVAAVCAAVRAALQATGTNRFLRAILTSHAKSGELEAALAIVKERKEAELQQGGPTPGAPSAEDGLKHLLLFLPEDTVYQAALGMYDLPLAYMVVAHSQKDPGEYMLELQRFAALPEGPRRGAAVDRHLRRWGAALAHLAAGGEADAPAALELARERGLLRSLLALYEGQPALRQRALEAYAEELERKGMDEDAGLAYIAAGLPEQAIDAYVAAGQWRMALALAGKLGRSAEDMRRLAAELVEELAGSARPAEAAAVAVEYLQDIPTAVALLARAREWREALRMAYSYSRAELVESIVAPGAAEAAADVLREAGEDEERVSKYWARLQELRQRRQHMEAALAAADAEAGLPSRQQEPYVDDAASEAPSAVSGLSAYTDRTLGGTSVSGSSLAPSTVGGRAPARQRKKQRQKKGKGSTRIRQGSPEEEQQLAEHILSLAPSPELCNQVGQLTEALVVLGHEADARLLQQRLAALAAAQGAAAADILQHPPPALALQLSWRAEQALEAAAAGAAGGAGPSASGGLAAAVAGVLAATPGAALQLQAAQAEATLKAARWKWDLLRSS